MSYPAAPRYGRKKANELIRRMSNEASESVRLDCDPVEIKMSQRDVKILANMLYEMDRHLPDFFEEGVMEDEG